MIPKEITLKIEFCIANAMSEGDGNAELQLVLLKTNLYELISKILEEEISQHLHSNYQTRFVS